MIKYARELAATVEYDHVEYRFEWKGYSVFFAAPKELLGSCYGYPTYVLVDEENNARFAEMPDEVMQILQNIPDDD